MDITLNLTDSVVHKLESLSDRDNFVNRVLEQALEERYRFTSEQKEEIKESLDQAKKGIFISDDEVNRFFNENR